ncbi:hypothetical protein FCJ61_04905 [Burkholderia metallica]|nr:hypothetical protein [Burkholderia metallica]
MAVSIAGSAAVAWQCTSSHYEAVIADMKTDQAAAAQRAETSARKHLEAEQKRGDILSTKLAQTETALNQKTLEASRALARLTTGRTCLDGRVVRVLNGTDTNSAADDVRATASTPDAANEPAATDTDVAGWINHAKGEYETCRARLGALIDFEEGRAR